MTTIKEVADLAGVSIATVSRFLNNPDLVSNKTRQKVEKVITQTKFVPSTSAKSLRSGKTGLIIVVIPRIGDAFYDGIIQSISKQAKTKGYNILVKEALFSSFELDDYLAMINSKQADGIILCVSLPQKVRDAIKSYHGTPIVMACEANDDFPLPNVRIDNFLAAKEATDYLIQLGHQRIAYISGYDNSSADKQREAGFSQAMMEAGLSEKKLIIRGGSTLEDARTATEELLKSPIKPTASFCGNDEMAIGVLHELKANNIQVPDDMSVIGFDNIRYAEMTTPTLTTISQPNRDIGTLTMDILSEIIDGLDKSNHTEVLAHKLIIRQSTSTPRVS